MEIEINGVKYQKKEQPKRKPMSKMVATTLIMAQMFGGGFPTGTSKSNDDIDIPKEYELIQQKKSKLSRAQREWVVYHFERNYQRV